MKFLVATYGTEGDTRPLAALCRALTDAGHETTLMADRSTLGVAAALGVPSVALSGDIKGSVDPAAAISNVVGKDHGLNSMAHALAGIANANADAWLWEIVTAGEGCGGIIVSALAAFVGLSAAEHLGVNAIGTGFIPRAAEVGERMRQEDGLAVATGALERSWRRSGCKSKRSAVQDEDRCQGHFPSMRVRGSCSRVPLFNPAIVEVTK